MGVFVLDLYLDRLIIFYTLAKSQILQQASTAMLAQANASKQNVLSLLQG